MNPRLRRLESDYLELRRRFDADPHIDVMPVGAHPPDRYQIVYRVPTLRLDAANRVQRADQTIVTLVLPSAYPREKPYAETVEPVFHPNFGTHICIADFWAPGQSLADIVSDIGDMLQFRRYNIRSPLNAVAAEWANQNAATLPLATIDLGAVDGDLIISVRAAQDGAGHD